MLMSKVVDQPVKEKKEEIQDEQAKKACPHYDCPAGHCEQIEVERKPLSEVIHQLVGKWKEESSEGLDDFMKALDVNVIKRKLTEHTNFKEEWSVDGSEVTFKMSNPFKSSTTAFQLGKLFEDDTMDGRKALVVYSVEDNKLVCRQHREPHSVIYTRSIDALGLMHVTMYIDNLQIEPVVAKMTLHRVDEDKEMKV